MLDGVGHPGMPEVGNMPSPVERLASGITDMMRTPDARMSRAVRSTGILHVVSESTGVATSMSLPAASITTVPPERPALRTQRWTPATKPPAAGYERPSDQHVMPAEPQCSPMQGSRRGRSVTVTMAGACRGAATRPERSLHIAADGEHRALDWPAQAAARTVRRPGTPSPGLSGSLAGSQGRAGPPQSAGAPG